MPKCVSSQGSSGVNRRQQREPVGSDVTVRSSATSQPAIGESGTTRPAETKTSSTQGHLLNYDTIVRLVYDHSPQVQASREEMVAARYGLDEFRNNLSRLEPFVKTTGDTSRFPERRDSNGLEGEIVAGVEKETFAGTIIRVEGGASASRVEFGEVEEDQDEIESGSGGLVRARVELPFVGSRKRQERVIDQTFQESQARAKELQYLTDYRACVVVALQRYQDALCYLGMIQVYKNYVEQLGTLLRDPHVRKEDRLQVRSSLDSARVNLRQQEKAYRESKLQLLVLLGASPQEKVRIEEPGFVSSSFMERARTPEGREKLLIEAFENNPKFQVLENAIQDFQLQKEQAILGHLDVMVFFEGTQFAFGAETFDDRVGGWEVGGGVSLRLNDKRVLKATRLKAEAQIRRYQADIEAEQLEVKRAIAINTDQLCSNYEQSRQNQSVINQKRFEFERRLQRYLEDADTEMTVDDVLIPLGQWATAGKSFEMSRYHMGVAEIALRAATGEVYRLVGMEVNGE